MAFISSSQVSVAASGVENQFNFFARPITIYKEPTQTVVTDPTNYLYGYDENQTTNDQITYTSVSAIHSGIIIYPFKVKNQQSQLFDNKILINPNATYIKLKQAGRDYILNGIKNEKLEFDGQTWNFTEGNKYQVQSYMTLNYYYFEVKGTN